MREEEETEFLAVFATREVEAFDPEFQKKSAYAFGGASLCF